MIHTDLNPELVEKGVVLASLRDALETEPELLETVVHEGLHMRRGPVWGARLKSGTRYVHANGTRLVPITGELDEGTVQLLTEHVISKLRKKGLAGHKSTAYPKAKAALQQILSKLNVAKSAQVSYLKSAYFDAKSADVEKKVSDLQLHQ